MAAQKTSKFVLTYESGIKLVEEHFTEYDVPKNIIYNDNLVLDFFHDMLKNFNNTLKHGEKPRKFFKLEREWRELKPLKYEKPKE